MAKPKIDYVKVDRTEYEALCELRDSAHERVKGELELAKLKAQQVDGNYQQCLAVNREQVSRMTAQLLEIETLRTRESSYQREVARLTAEVEKYKPATLNVGQGLFSDVPTVKR